jgi:hypothetical protein
VFDVVANMLCVRLSEPVAMQRKGDYIMRIASIRCKQVSLYMHSDAVESPTSIQRAILALRSGTYENT